MESGSFRRKFQNLMAIPLVMLTVLLSVVIVFGLLHPDSYGELAAIWSLGRRVLVLAAGIGLFLFLLLLLFTFLEKLHDAGQRKVLLCLCICAFLMQVFLVLRYPLQIWWDNTSVLTSAISIVTGEKSWFDVIYFNQVGHQNCFLLLTVILVEIARICRIPMSAYTIYFSLIDMVAMDLALVFAILLVKKTVSQNAARRTLLFALLCPGMYLWAGYYYTTNLSLFFISLYCYLLYLIWEKKRNPVLCFLFGAFAAFGMQLRMTVLLFILATVLFTLFKRPAAPIRTFACAAAGLTCMLIILNVSYQKLNPDYDEDARFPVTHWLMMAAQGNGEYNDADLAYTSSFETKEEKAAATKAEYFRRLKELGVGGTAALAMRKTTHNWSYGNHSYYPLFHRYDRLSDLLWTPDHQIMFYWEQVYHLTMLLCVLAGVLIRLALLFKRRRDQSYGAGFEAFLQIALVGGFCFYMLWETFPYYSVGFLTVFWMMSAEALDVLGNAAKGCILRLHGKKKHLAAAAAFCVCLAAVVVLSLSGISDGTSVKPVVTQKKLDRMISMKGAKKAEQTFTASRSFDTVSFWIGKEDMTSSGGGIYDIAITSERSGEVFRQRYDSRAMTRVDEFTVSFPAVEPAEGEKFSLSVECMETDGENALTLGGYDLPVEAYLYGSFYLDGKQQSGEMFFTVTSGGADDVIRLYD